MITILNDDFAPVTPVRAEKPLEVQSMRVTSPQKLTLGSADINALRLWREMTTPRIALIGIVALAAGLRFANLAALGYANHYYAAGVASMLKSWHNFFYVAAEPGGSVSIDKPPVGLWIQAISAYIFGVDGFGVLLPQILAGILSVIVVYHLVRRSFGMVAGLLAALVLAITPISVAVDRNNTIDSTLILTLLLAAWAFIKATESGRLRYLLLGVALVGIGFNIKMLQAYLPLPAFYALYFFGARESLWRKVPKLALATVLLLVVSLSWAVAVDLTPADQRPYVGSSDDNSELSLAIGYNGIERLNGMNGRGGLLSSFFGGDQGNGPGNRAQPGRPGPNGGFVPPGPNGGLAPPGPNGGLAPLRPNGGFAPPGPNGGFRQPGANGARPQPGPNGNGQFIPSQPGGNGFPAPAGPGFPGGGGGINGVGQPGALRLLIAPLSKEVSWLLPFGLFGVVLLAFSTGLSFLRKEPVEPGHQTIVLWGGWLLTGAAFFSVAGFFHEYYLAMLAAPLAALVGIGAIVLWRFRGHHRWLATVLLIIAAGGTLWFQLTTARAFVTTVWWLSPVLGLFVAGAAVSIVAALRPKRLVAIAGFGVVIAALLITPGIWSGLTVMNSSANQSLPSAYSGRPSGPANRGGLQVNQALLDYLTANTGDTEYLMAVPSSMQGADYVLATGRPVLYLGGFMGQDKVASGDDLSRLVADGKLRYIYWTGNGRGGQGDQAEISSWVSANCTAVQGFDTQTQNAGAPDGTAMGRPGGPQGFGAMQVSLYACGGRKS